MERGRSYRDRPWKYTSVADPADMRRGKTTLQLQPVFGCVVYKYLGDTEWHQTPFFTSFSLADGSEVFNGKDISGDKFKVAEPLTIGNVN